MSSQEVVIDQYYVDCLESRRLCSECYISTVCLRCKNLFCTHFSSKIDFRFCQYCMTDITLEDSIIRKSYVVTSLSGSKKWTRVQKARLLVFKGQDWMFSQRRILDLSESEIDLNIEYHRTLLGELMNEKEARQIAKNKKALNKLVLGSSGASMKIPAKAGINTDGSANGVGTITVHTTTVKKTKTTVPHGAQLTAAIAGIVAMLKAQGLSDAEVKARLMSMAAGGKK